MHEIADAERLRRFMAELGKATNTPTTVYLTGGATAVLHGWRNSTLDADITLQPENDELLRALPRIKESLQLNVELAAPDHFIPPLPGWEERSPFIATEGSVTFRHYDFYAQALSKIARGSDQDMEDARAMRERGFISNERLLELFADIEPSLYKYPALDPATFRRAVENFTA